MERPQGRFAVTRRRFLYLSAAAATGLVAAACGGEAAAPTATTGAQPTPGAQPTTAAQPTATAGQQTPAARPTAAAQPTAAGQQTPATTPAKYQEAPQLAAQVKAGKLPSVEERLPKNPLVVQPVEKVGKYGGAWRTVLVGGDDTAWLTRTLDYENLVRWDLEFTKVIPNIAESFKGNDEGTEYTFKLREGIKWSDGQPFTADDIMFWYEDVASNKELSPGGLPDWMKSGGKAGTVEKVDRHTVRFKFENPHGLLPKNLATPFGAGPTNFPRHYLEQFHKKYNGEKLDQLVKQSGQKDWPALFDLKSDQWANHELPRLHAWQPTTSYGENTTQIVAERNPYYWKVDPEGNQLPYLDSVVYDQVGNVEVAVLKALNGEIDMQDRHIASLQNKPVFFNNQQKGNYRLFEEVPVESTNSMAIQLNLTHRDQMKREIFQNKDFRIGLSHAINRQEIIDVAYVGQGEPYQPAPRPKSRFYNERLARQYTEYDVQNANAHLDKVLPQKDAEGFRLGPDGQRFFFQVEVIPTFRPEHVDVLEMIKRYWQKVGIDMEVKSENRSLFQTRRDANEHDAQVWAGGADGIVMILEPSAYFPHGPSSRYAVAWQYWYNGDPRGEEPPEEVKRQMTLYEQLMATISEEKQAELMKQILEIAADQFYTIGINLMPLSYGIVKNNFHNVPESIPQGFLYPTPAPTNPSQYFKVGG